MQWEITELSASSGDEEPRAQASVSESKRKATAGPQGSSDDVAAGSNERASSSCAKKARQVPSKPDVPAGCKDVTELSTSSEPAVPVAALGEGGKRKRGQAVKKRADLADPCALHKLLAKPCHKRCRRQCREFFKFGDGFQQLLSFRREWKSLRKLDQDAVAPRRILLRVGCVLVRGIWAICFFFRFAWKIISSSFVLFSVARDDQASNQSKL